MNEPPLIVGPSPTASNITNAINETVDLYTGRLNVNLPLYTLTSRDISVPITLSYNTTGAKVDEIAGWVGLGWTLHAGGAISRVMKGLPDEFLGKVTPNSYAIEGGEGINAFGYINIKDREDGVILSQFDSYDELKQKKIVKYGEWQSITGFNIGNGFGFGEAWDTQPDEFYFNFGNYSGKFVFDQYGNIQTIPHQNLKIQKTIDNSGDIPKIIIFMVFTPDGYTYTFGDENYRSVEQTKLITERMRINYRYNFLNRVVSPPELYNYRLWQHTPWVMYRVNDDNEPLIDDDGYLLPDYEHTAPDYPFHTSTWYLKEIKSPKGEIVTFNYFQPLNDITYTRSREESVIMRNLFEIYSLSWEWVYMTKPDDDAPNTGGQTVAFMINHETVDTRRLMSIETNTRKRITFNVGDKKREDFLEDKYLERIRIIDNDKNIKYFHFNYDYLNPTTYTGRYNYVCGTVQIDENDNHRLAYFYDNSDEETIISEQKRLLLKGVYEYDETETKNLPPYVFEYNEQPIPRRGSYKRDKWGYYNGNTIGSKIPWITYTDEFGFTTPISGLPLMSWSLTPENNSMEGANLTANEELTKAGTLKSIKYPTGGMKQFFYELNTGFGGLRIKEIKTIPASGNSDDIIQNSYTYSGGQSVAGHRFDYSLAYDNYGKRSVFGSSVSFSPFHYTKGGVVGYETVTEYQTGKGKTTYTFINPAVEPDDNTTIYEVGVSSTYENKFPFPDNIDNDWKRGLISEVTVSLDNSNNWLKKDTFSYN